MLLDRSVTLCFAAFIFRGGLPAMSKYFQSIQEAPEAGEASVARPRASTGSQREETETATPVPTEEEGNAAPDVDERKQQSAHSLQAEPSPPLTREETGEPIPNQQAAQKWYVKLPDGLVYGPVAPLVLCDWAVQGRVVPTNQVSQDGCHWLPATAIPALISYWVDGSFDHAKAGPKRKLRKNGMFSNHVSETQRRRINRGLGQVATTADRMPERKIDPAHQDATDPNGNGHMARVFKGELQLIRNWPL